MKEPANGREKWCPVCEKEYGEQDNYCGDDGAVLERAQLRSAKQPAPSASTADHAVDAKAQQTPT